MPHDSDSIPLPAPLLDALDAEIALSDRSRFVADAVAAALLHHRIGARGGDPGLEPWWPLDRADFVVLSSGEYRLQRREEGEE